MISGVISGTKLLDHCLPVVTVDVPAVFELRPHRVHRNGDRPDRPEPGGVSQLGIGNGNVGLKGCELCPPRSGDSALLGLHRRHSLALNRCIVGGRYAERWILVDGCLPCGWNVRPVSSDAQHDSGLLGEDIEDGVWPSQMEQYPVAVENKLRWHHYRYSPADACGDQMAERVALDERSPLFEVVCRVDPGDTGAHDEYVEVLRVCRRGASVRPMWPITF